MPSTNAWQGASAEVGATPTPTSARQRVLQRKAVLLTTFVTIVFERGLVAFEPPVGGNGRDATPDALQLRRRQWREIRRNAQILPQHAHRIDPADRGRDRQAHRIAQRVLDTDHLLLHRLARAAQALHAERGDALPEHLRQNALLEAAER